MARWVEKKEILRGPTEEDFLFGLRGVEEARRPVTFAVRSLPAEIGVLLERIERYNNRGSEYLFYGRLVANPSRRVRGWYDHQTRIGGIAYRFR